MIRDGAGKNLIQVKEEYRHSFLPWKRLALYNEMLAYEKLFQESSAAHEKRVDLFKNFNKEKSSELKIPKIDFSLAQKNLSKSGKQLSERAEFIDNVEATGRWLCYGLASIVIGSSVGMIALTLVSTVGIAPLAATGIVTKAGFSAYLIASFFGAAFGGVGGLLSYGFLSLLENSIASKYYGAKTWEQALEDTRNQALVGLTENGLAGIGLGFAGVFSRVFAGITGSLVKNLYKWSIQGSAASLVNSPINLAVRYFQAYRTYAEECLKLGINQDPQLWFKIAGEYKVSAWEIPKDIAYASVSGIIGGNSDLLRNAGIGLKKQIAVDALEFLSASLLGVSRALIETDNWSYKNIGQAATQEIVSNMTSSLRTHARVGTGYVNHKLKLEQNLLNDTAGNLNITLPNKIVRTSSSKNQISFRHIDEGSNDESFFNATIQKPEGHREDMIFINQFVVQSDVATTGPRMVEYFAREYYRDYLSKGRNLAIRYLGQSQNMQDLFLHFKTAIEKVSNGKYSCEILPEDISIFAPLKILSPLEIYPCLLRPFEVDRGNRVPRIHPRSSLSSDFTNQIYKIIVDNNKFLSFDALIAALKSRPLKAYRELFPKANDNPQCQKDIYDIDSRIIDINNTAENWNELKQTYIGRLRAVTLITEGLSFIDEKFYKILSNDFHSDYINTLVPLRNADDLELRKQARDDLEISLQVRRHQLNPVPLDETVPQNPKTKKEYQAFTRYQLYQSMEQGLLELFPEEMRPLVAPFCRRDVIAIYQKEKNAKFSFFDKFAGLHISGKGEIQMMQMLLFAKWKMFARALQCSDEGLLRFQNEYKDLFDCESVHSILTQQVVYYHLEYQELDNAQIKNLCSHPLYSAVLPAKPLEAYLRLINTDKVFMEISGLTEGSRSCLRIFLYAKLLANDEETAIKEFKIKAEAVRDEENRAKRNGLKAFGMELQFPVIPNSKDKVDISLTYAYKLALEIFGIRSPINLHFGKVVEASFHPTYSPLAYELGADSILKLGLLGKTICNIGMHLTFPGDFDRKTERFIAIPLHLPNPNSPFTAEQSYQQLYANPRTRNFVLRNLFTKGLVRRRDRNINYFELKHSGERLTEFRSGRRRNDINHPQDLAKDNDRLIRALWYLSHAMHSDHPWLRSLASSYKQKMDLILSSDDYFIIKKGKTLSPIRDYFQANWRQKISTRLYPYTWRLSHFELSFLRTPKKLAAFWKYLAENPRQNQDLYKRITALVYESANKVADILDLPKV